LKKNWPAENFAALARQIGRRIRAVMVIGPAEAAIEPIFAGEFVTLDGRELGEIVGMAHLAAGFVGNDSGVSHLAAAAGAIGVVLFGPTDPERWRPRGRVEVLRRDPLASLPVGEVAERLADLCQSSSGMVTINAEGSSNARALFDWKKDRS
jgi:ADP-heptose:LPS heptosyltransferase